MKADLVAFKKLLVRPSGHITGGFLQYSIDDQTGVVTYSGEVEVHIFFFSKTFPIEGTYKVNPDRLKSASIAMHERYAEGPVTLECVKCVPGKSATVHVAIVDDSMQAAGHIGLDLSGPTISIIGADIAGKIQGYDADLILG